MSDRAGSRLVDAGGKPLTPPASALAGAKVKILVAVPTVKWQCTVDIASFAMKLGMASMMPEVPWEFAFKSSSGHSGLSYPVDYNRNLLVGYAIATEYDWIWFVDSDVLPKDNFIGLLTQLGNADVVAGIYPLLGKDPDPPVAWTAYVWGKGTHKETKEEIEGFLLADPREHGPIIEGGAAGTGAMLISRKVFTDPKMRLGPDEDGVPQLFKLQYSPAGKLIATEDMDFCRRLRANGYKLLVDTRVQWGHVKLNDVKYMEDAMQWAFDNGRERERMEAERAAGNAAVRGPERPQ